MNGATLALAPFRETLVTEAAVALRKALPAPPRWLLVSRFGVEFLGPAARRAAPIEIALESGIGRLLARPLQLGGIDLLALECEPAIDVLRLSPALCEALPLLIGGQAGAVGAIQLLSALGISGVTPAPALAAIGDWLRLSDDDPLRAIDLSRCGARFPELRGYETGLGSAACVAALDRHVARQRVVAATRRGPSGPTDAELIAWKRLGADVVVEGCAAEWVAARQQGLRFQAIALVLDSALQAPTGDPRGLATAAAVLLPRVAALLTNLLEAVAAEPTALPPRAECHG